MVELATKADGNTTPLDAQLFPEHFYEAETFVAPSFASVIDRYYQRFYKPIRQTDISRML